MKTTINKDQKLYVFDHGKFVTCLGFTVCLDRLTRLATELNAPVKSKRKGTFKMLRELHSLQRKVAQIIGLYSLSPGNSKQ